MFCRRTLKGTTWLVALGIFCSTTRLVDGATTVDGYLIDKQCNILCDGKDADVTCTPDNVNTFYQPQGHTGWCLLLPPCVASGYVLMSDTPESSSGKHTILLDLSNSTEASKASIIEYIEQGTSGSFPKVTIEYDDTVEGTREVDGIVHVQEIMTIRDPWETSDAYYDDNAEDTEIVICQDSTAPDIAKNNMCYRSDIIVTDQSNTITIESNGCPTHANMLNSTGKITNTQVDPTKEDGVSTTSSCGTCSSGACCSGCCSATFTCSGGGGDCCSASCSGGCDACSGGCDACSGGCDAGDNMVMGNTTATARIGGNPFRNLQQEGEDTGCDACSAGGCDGCSAGGCNGCSAGGCDGCSAGDCCSSMGAGCCSAAGGCCGATAAACCAASCASTSPGPYAPMYHHYTMIIPSNPGTPGDAVYFSDGDEVVGILVNGVLLDSHKPTWSYDSCNGHSDTKHQYHYHIPPTCLMESLGIPTPAGANWWINDDGTQVREYADMANQFPSSSSTSSMSPIIGFAKDGYPIFGPYDEEGVLQLGATYNDDSTLDECNGKVDSHGNYGYYMTVTPPFSPPCLRGPEKGTFSYSKHADDKLCPAQGIRTKIIPLAEVMDSESPDSTSSDSNSPSSSSTSSSSRVGAPFGIPFLLMVGIFFIR